MCNKPRRKPVMSLFTACVCPAVGASAPLPNSSARNGLNAAACRVTLIDCARSQGNTTGAGPLSAVCRFDGAGTTRVVAFGSVSIIVAIVFSQRGVLYRNNCPQQRQYCAEPPVPQDGQVHCPPTNRP